MKDFNKTVTGYSKHKQNRFGEIKLQWNKMKIYIILKTESWIQFLKSEIQISKAHFTNPTPKIKPKSNLTL